MPEVSPCCQAPMKERDKRKRIMKYYQEEKRYVMVPRMQCTCCDRLHTALPEQLTPRRHYATGIIENAVDDVRGPEDYPCAGTMPNDGFLHRRGCRYQTFQC